IDGVASYRLENATASFNAGFVLDTERGAALIRVRNDRAFDAERPSFSDTIIATSTDGSEARLDVQLQIIDVEEFAPTLTASASSSEPFIRENIPGDSVLALRITARDDDATDVVERIEISDPRFEFRDSSVIPDTVSGTISLRDGIVLDAEAEQTISLVATAVVSDGTTATLPLRITVFDSDEFVPEVPIDRDPGTANNVLEDAAPGTYTGLTAFARDRDATS
ncbi:MAG: hypothetical protein AAFQ17_03125, partial [Pseudomonadota bacterium]